jgi:hypothetical protein
MRLNSTTGPPVYYAKTGLTYSNTPVGLGNSLLMPMNNVVNYSSALKALGIYGAYGFQLTLTPAVTISISNTSTSPLTLSINARGASFPLANAPVSYYFLPVSLNGNYPSFLTEELQTGTVTTDAAGTATQSFSLASGRTYVFIAYADIGGLTGVGFYAPSFSGSTHLIPFVDSLNGTVLLAHSSDVPNTAPSAVELNYTSAFVKFSSEDFELQNAVTGEVWSGAGHAPQVVTVPNYAGVIVTAYRDASGNGGVAVMPWEVGSLAFPVAFGDDPAKQEWVATDMRQVLVNGVAYQAKLSLWSFAGVQVIG